jgi:hypothetical protein
VKVQQIPLLALVFRRGGELKGEIVLDVAAAVAGYGGIVAVTILRSGTRTPKAVGCYRVGKELVLAR